MERVQRMNPFAKRESFSRRSVHAYRTLSILTWLLVLVVGTLHSFFRPGGLPTIWDQNRTHPTPFALDPIITGLYWAILLVLQICYIYFLFGGNAEVVKVAANVGSHYILNNALLAVFILLWVRSRYWWCEVILVLNFYNMTSLYFRHHRAPRFVHLPVVVGPLAWAFVAIFWNGAVMVDAYNLAARITANIFIWSFLLYGFFFLAAFKDGTMGFAISILSTSLAIQQFTIKVVALQWIFAFVIMAVLFLLTLIVTIPGFFGKEFTFVRENSETEPLLSDEE